MAQNAARAARSLRLPGDRRRLRLAAARLHDIGYALAGPHHAAAGARALRLTGHEQLARIVAHHSNAAERARLAGPVPIADEFRHPEGPDALVPALLDVSDPVTGPHGERVDPVGRHAGPVERHGHESPAVAAVVRNVNRLGADLVTRALVEELSAQPVPS